MCSGNVATLPVEFASTLASGTPIVLQLASRASGDVSGGSGVHQRLNNQLQSNLLQKLDFAKRA